jgi:ribonuclease HI
MHQSSCAPFEALSLALQFYDGGSRSNPGHAGCGAILYAFPKDVIDTDSAYLGVATNNVAEYQGLILGLKLALKHGIRGVDISGDSKLVKQQVLGHWQVNDEKLRVLWDVAHSLLSKFDDWNVNHVRRNDNDVADRLVNEAIDAGLGGKRSVRTPSRELF